MEKEFVVKPEETAKCIGSGGLDVLATPALIAYVEHVCFEELEVDISPLETSVGVKIEMLHLKPTKVSEKVNVKTAINEKKGKKVSFSFEVFHKDILIASGYHQRVFVDKEQFLSQL